jgi:hypothetical protein
METAIDVRKENIYRTARCLLGAPERCISVDKAISVV